jgi:hypothetical protein
MPERNAIGHTQARFKQAGVGTKRILERKYLSKNAHRTHRTERTGRTCVWVWMWACARVCGGVLEEGQGLQVSRDRITKGRIGEREREGRRGAGWWWGR